MMQCIIDALHNTAPEAQCQALAESLHWLGKSSARTGLFLG